MKSPVFSLGIQPTMFVDVMRKQYLLHYIVARSRSCFHGKATVHFPFFLFIGVDVVVINIKVSVLLWKCNSELPVYCAELPDILYCTYTKLLNIMSVSVYC